MKELFSGTDKCTTHSYCSFYEQLLSVIPKDPSILNISPTVESDAKAFKAVWPDSDIWCLTSDREQALGAIRAGAKALCTNLYDVRGLNDWLGVKQFDLIIDDGSHKLIDQFRTVLIGYKRLKKKGRLIIEDVPTARNAELLGDHIEDFTAVKSRKDDRIVWFTKDEPLPNPAELTISGPMKYTELKGTVLYSEFSGNVSQFLSLIECVHQQTMKPNAWIILNKDHHRLPLYFLRLANCPIKIVHEAAYQKAYINLQESEYYPEDFIEHHAKSIPIVNLTKAPVKQEIKNQYASLSAPAAAVDTVDVVLPLGNGSRNNNDELRICLRSIERFMPAIGKVWLLTSYAPDWVRNVEIIDIPDKHKHNKDANLFDKVLSAASNPRVSKTFVFFSDDQCLIAPFDPFTAQVVYNTRGPSAFTTTGTWHRRMAHTFEYLKSKGVELDCNFDGHVPMVYTKEEFVRALKGVDYVPEPGFCINTLVCGILGKPKEVSMNDVKVTAESGGDRKFDGKLYVGYNDTGFSGGMRDALFKAFPLKSKYEA